MPIDKGLFLVKESKIWIKSDCSQPEGTHWIIDFIQPDFNSEQVNRDQVAWIGKLIQCVSLALGAGTRFVRSLTG